jgi:hypothetical protein
MLCSHQTGDAAKSVGRNIAASISGRSGSLGRSGIGSYVDVTPNPSILL